MYTSDGNEVTLAMTVEDFQQLLLMLGFAMSGARAQGDLSLHYNWVQAINRLNEGNPSYTPYEVPEEFRRKKQ